MTGHSWLKTFPQLFTVTLEVTVVWRFCFWAPISSMPPPQLPNTARKAKNLKSSLWEWFTMSGYSFQTSPNRQLDTFTASQQKNSLHNKEEAANRNKRLLEIQEKFQLVGQVGQRNTCRTGVCFHARFLVPAPSSAPCHIPHSPFRPSHHTTHCDVPRTATQQLLECTGFSTDWAPWPCGCCTSDTVAEYRWTRFNSHIHLGGLWDTKGTSTVTMNFCTWEAGAEDLQVTALKWVLVKRQTKHTSTEPESLNTLMQWAPRLVPTAVPQKILESGTAHFAALQDQQIWPSEPPQTVLPELWHKRLYRAKGIPIWRSASKPPAADGVTFTAVVTAIQNCNIPTLKDFKQIFSSSIILKQTFKVTAESHITVAGCWIRWTTAFFSP